MDFANISINFMKLFLCGYLVIFMTECSGKGEKEKITNTVPRTLFGINMPWENFADGSVIGGELIRDRSFRSKNDPILQKVWAEVLDGGSISYPETDGDTSPAGKYCYPGCAELSRTTSGFTYIAQSLTENFNPGTSYDLNFSFRGNGTDSVLIVYIYTPDPFKVISSVLIISVKNTEWDRYSNKLSVNEASKNAAIGFFLKDQGSIRIDEVRLAKSSTEPSVKDESKKSLKDLGAKSLRWPGGTLVDSWHWKASVGPRIERGEVKTINNLETPSLGLHEFLDLCELLSLVPVIQVNVLDSPQNASDLIEYILGNSATKMGSVRNKNGRKKPWDVSFFEIGNEPSLSYSSTQIENTGYNYANLAKPIIAAMKNKSKEIGKKINIGGVIEPCFQLADWLPNSPNQVVQMISNWNNQVLDKDNGIGKIDFLDGHFYSYRHYHQEEKERFVYAMAGGLVLERIIKEKILPSSICPIWITEYNILSENDGTLEPSFNMDFQSGLVTADILIKMIENEVKGAHFWNLSQNWFGMTLNLNNGTLRPAGMVFKLISPLAGEEKIQISSSNNETFAIETGAGITPGNTVYPIISAIATKNINNGKPRIIILNRSYDKFESTIIALKGFTQNGKAKVWKYECDNLSSNNEENEKNVTITEEVNQFTDEIKITMKPHSLQRIDF